MVRGRVIGRYWATKRVETLPQGGLLGVEIDGGERVIAFDPLGCADDEHVLITQGSVASAYFGSDRAPIDALIVGSLDE